MVARHRSDDGRPPLLPGDLHQDQRKPLVPRFIVVLFVVGLVWTWVLLLVWWILRDGAG